MERQTKKLQDYSKLEGEYGDLPSLNNKSRVDIKDHTILVLNDQIKTTDIESKALKKTIKSFMNTTSTLTEDYMRRKRY